MSSTPSWIAFSRNAQPGPHKVTRYTIDRFEGDWAVLEDEQGRTFSVPRHWLPTDAAEAAVLKASADGVDGAVKTLRFELDFSARDERLKNARSRREQLPRGPKGNVSL